MLRVTVCNPDGRPLTNGAVTGLRAAGSTWYSLTRCESAHDATSTARLRRSALPLRLCVAVAGYRDRVVGPFEAETVPDPIAVVRERVPAFVGCVVTQDGAPAAGGGVPRLHPVRTPAILEFLAANAPIWRAVRRVARPVGGCDPNQQQGTVMTFNALSSLGAIGLLALLPTRAASDPSIAPPQSSPFGQDYAAWSANWWQWFMEHPVAGHPAIDDPSFDVTSGQSGNVWFLATPVEFGTATPTPILRNITIHAGTALFVGMINGEMSSLEGAATEQDQRDIANFQADRIVDLACSIDGRSVKDLDRYRFESEQFSFTAPDPWIFSPAPSGTGTAVADGYYVFVHPLSVGTHQLHCSGGFHFEAGVFGPEPFDISGDVTYVITVVP